MSNSLITEDATRALVTKWRASEEVCRDLAALAAKWTADFYVPDTRTFKVAYSNREKFQAVVEPNAATSSVVLVTKDIETFTLDLAGISSIGVLREQVNACLVQLPTWDLQKLLPLRSFGPLPLFSVTYLAEALSYCENPLVEVAYAICMRRILFELFQSQKQHWVQKSDEIHPYLLFHCTRALLRLRSLLDNAHKAGNTAAINTFTENIADNQRIRKILKGAKYDRRTIDKICGVSAENIDFQTEYLGETTGPTGAGTAIHRAVQFIEGLASSQAVKELAKDSGQQKRAADPSVLAFALYTLSILNPQRHHLLLGQGVQALAETCERGHFQPGRPFNIDSHGRALAVTSMEVSSALLAIALARVNIADNTEITVILEATKDIELLLAEDRRQIEITDDPGTGMRQGWCSDRAPSSHRVDAWVTVYAALFFLQRLRLLAAVKRRHVLARYSWISHKQCRPKWDRIEDPNEGTTVPSLKDTIENAVIIPPSGKRMRAPVFLLYGPPGTSKTTFVHGIASRMRWDLVTLSPSDFIADSLDRIELRAREIFEDLGNLDQCVILLDEMDSLLRDREILAEKSAGTIMEFVVPALLPKLQQLRDYTLDKHMAVFFVSNYYETIDAAILRSGRIDAHLQVLPYGKEARTRVLSSLAKRDLTKLNDGEHNELLTYVEKLPCNLVYRDLESLVQAVAAAPVPRNVASILDTVVPTLGISPEIYKPSRRPKAYAEFCAMVARLQNSEPPKSSAFLTREAARKFLQKIMPSIKEESEWRQMTDTWIENLKQARPSG